MESRSLLPSAGPARSRSPPFRLYGVAICACLTPLSYGVCLGFTSPAFPDMSKDGFITAEEVRRWCHVASWVVLPARVHVGDRGVQEAGSSDVRLPDHVMFRMA